MDPVSPLPAIIAMLAAILTADLISRKIEVPQNQGRFSSIDGLRGYLAFFVFLHHSSVWYFYLKTGQWKVPPSQLFTHFGQGGVVFFFMITGFLFFSKLIDGKAREIDWGRLFVSRFLRLVPLYLFLMILLFIVVAHLSKWDSNEGFLSLAANSIQWLGFTVLGAPNLNGIQHTSVIVAGVTWSLPYEWFFYFTLPVLAVTIGIRPSLPYLLVGLASVVFLIIWEPKLTHLLSFVGGIVASTLVRIDSVCRFSTRRVASYLVICCTASVVLFFPFTYGLMQIFLLSIVFVIIAGGNDLFGLLASSASRILGEMAYSIYLLHGVFLFSLFTFVIGREGAGSLSSIGYWLVIITVTPILIMISFVTFYFIERPAMKSTNAVTVLLRTFTRSGRRSKTP